MCGEGEAVPCGEGADAWDDGDAAGGGSDAEVCEVVAFGEGEGGEFAGGAAGDEAVDAGLNHVFDVGVEAGFVDG